MSFLKSSQCKKYHLAFDGKNDKLHWLCSIMRPLIQNGFVECITYGAIPILSWATILRVILFISGGGRGYEMFSFFLFYVYLCVYVHCVLYLSGMYPTFFEELTSQLTKEFPFNLTSVQQTCELNWATESDCPLGHQWVFMANIHFFNLILSTIYHKIGWYLSALHCSLQDPLQHFWLRIIHPLFEICSTQTHHSTACRLFPGHNNAKNSLASASKSNSIWSVAKMSTTALRTQHTVYFHCNYLLPFCWFLGLFSNAAATRQNFPLADCWWK